ncbi:MAG TPA: hypothetical protein VHK70_05295 [Burkholderiaceae bacterium]|jgi:hypothetical protein|nr:hypothetical protein [Burkholderiaceae bacterium]
MQRRLFIAALSSIAAVLAGCASPAPRPLAGPTVTVAPPPPQAETIPLAPYPDSYWIPGHWKWNGSSYVWARGHWDKARPNMVYQLAYWSRRGDYWVYHPGRWVSLEAPAVVSISETVTVAPPAPQEEAIPVAPSPTHVWISGYWRWGRGRHVWTPGHWAGARTGYFWAPGHWVRRRSGWVFSGGFWQRY